MTRTKPLALLVAVVLGIGAGFLLNHVLTSSGRSTFTPIVGLPVLLLLLGMLVVGLAIPVRRAVRDPRAPRVDPFRAMRTAVLAKASSLVGAVVAGGAGGLLAFVLTRPVTPALGSLGTIFATLVAASILVAAALVAEAMCIVPKDPDERDSDEPRPGAEPAA